MKHSSDDMANEFLVGCRGSGALPERVMWVHVILTAARDWIICERMDAKEWFHSDNSEVCSFKWILAMLGLDGLEEKVIRRISSPDFKLMLYQSRLKH